MEHVGSVSIKISAGVLLCSSYSELVLQGNAGNPLSEGQSYDFLYNPSLLSPDGGPKPNFVPMQRLEGSSIWHRESIGEPFNENRGIV